MPSRGIWAGALSLLLLHEETGCTHSAHNAARLLDQICEADDVDDDTRQLCEQASARLACNEPRHACPA